MKRRITEKGAPRTRKEAEKAWIKCWKDLSQARNGLSVYPGTSPRLFVSRVEMSIGRVVKEVMYVRMSRLSGPMTIYVVI